MKLNQQRDRLGFLDIKICWSSVTIIDFVLFIKSQGSKYLSFTYQFAPATYTGCRIRGSAFVINRLQNKVGLPQKVVSNIKHEISLKLRAHVWEPITQRRLSNLRKSRQPVHFRYDYFSFANDLPISRGESFSLARKVVHFTIQNISTSSLKFNITYPLL